LDASASREGREGLKGSDWTEAAFERAFRTHYDGVYRLLFRVVGSRVEAEDLAQETFLRCYRNGDPARDGNGPDDVVRPWLYHVALNLARNARRGRRRREARQERAARTGAATGDPAGSDDPADAIVRGEEREAVRRTLATLPDRQAEILLLRHAGLTYGEVATALDIAPASVGTLLARAETAFEAAYRPIPQSRSIAGGQMP
jgi:RNA polymerase sigma-70 factor (ECF subfamily)